MVDGADRSASAGGDERWFRVRDRGGGVAAAAEAKTSGVNHEPGRAPGRPARRSGCDGASAPGSRTAWRPLQGGRPTLPGAVRRRRSPYEADAAVGDPVADRVEDRVEVARRRLVVERLVVRCEQPDGFAGGERPALAERRVVVRLRVRAAAQADAALRGVAAWVTTRP